MVVKMVLIVVAFVLGLYMCSSYGSSDVKEPFLNKPRCPDILVQHGSELYLYNSKLLKVPGVNPVKFANLEEYKEFMDWQRSQGIKCPILYLQHSYDAQDQSQYSVRPDPLDPQGGLPDSLPKASDIHKTIFDNNGNEPAYNRSDYPAFDPSNQFVGLQVGADLIKPRTNSMGMSDDPMEPNWGGADQAKQSVKSGNYDDDKVWVKANRN